MRSALITGITGQDGSFLAELLLDKGYFVHGLIRRASTSNTQNIGHILNHERLCLHQGDLTDASSINKILKSSRPDEIYNLGAQSHVRVSFDTPVYTGDVDGLGTARLLEAMHTLNMLPSTRFYQASTSELFGLIQAEKQNESTPLYPRSPYGVAKLYAFWMVKNYREAYGAFACNGILFNHESTRRGKEFVTRKITSQVAEILRGERTHIELGNLDAQRDWGHAKDFVTAMWLILQQKQADDYVIATGEKHSVRELVEICFNYIEMPLHWKGQGVNEVGLDQNGVKRVVINSAFYRPAEVDTLLGDPTKAQTKLNWTPHYSFKSLIEEMLSNDVYGQNNTKQ